MTELQHPDADEEVPPRSSRLDLVAFQSAKSRAMLVVACLVSVGLWMALWRTFQLLASTVASPSFAWQTILATAVVVATSVLVIRIRQRESRLKSRRDISSRLADRASKP